MATRRVVVATHGHCFDGLCSAAMFTRLLRHLHPDDELELRYHAAGYGPGQNGVDPALLGGDINAILDFRFSRAPQLSWYFDHHVSAFPTPEDRAAYDARVSASEGRPEAERRMFHDGSYSSCTKLIADIGARVFGLPTDGHLADLVSWADIIDAARFPSADTAVARTEPALQLMTVVEHHGDDAFITRMVPRLLDQPLDQVALAPDIQAALEPLKAGHEGFVALVREHAALRGDVVLVDLLDRDIEVATKFVTYALYPRSAYSVMLTRSPKKCKISIGYNPWSQVPRRHDISAICERYGGGGHAVVGAVTLPPGDVARVREIAETITAELNRP